MKFGEICLSYIIKHSQNIGKQNGIHWKQPRERCNHLFSLKDGINLKWGGELDGPKKISCWLFQEEVGPYVITMSHFVPRQAGRLSWWVAGFS